MTKKETKELYDAIIEVMNDENAHFYGVTDNGGLDEGLMDANPIIKEALRRIEIRRKDDNNES